MKWSFDEFMVYETDNILQMNHPNSKCTVILLLTNTAFIFIYKYKSLTVLDIIAVLKSYI